MKKESRLKLYKEYVPKLLADKDTEISIPDLGKFDEKRKGKRGTIKLEKEYDTRETSTAHYKLTVKKGTLEIPYNGKLTKYEFYVKPVDQNTTELGRKHLLDNTRCSDYINEFDVLSVPVSYGAVSPFLHHVSEAAGKPLYWYLASDHSPELFLAAVANNIFGVSRETLEEELPKLKEKENSNKVCFFDSDRIIRPSPDENEKERFTGLFQKGLDRLLNQTESRYDRILQSLNSFNRDAAEKNLKIEQRDDIVDDKKAAFKKDLEGLLKVVEQTKKNIESDREIFLKETENYKGRYSKENIPVMFIPTDIVVPGMHIRIKNTEAGFRAYTIDGVLGENESPAGSPREAYEKLLKNSEDKETGKQFEKMPQFLKRLCDLIEKEYLASKPKVAHWIKYDETIKTATKVWYTAKENRSNTDRSIEELKGRLEDIFVKYTSPKNESKKLDQWIEVPQ